MTLAESAPQPENDDAEEVKPVAGKTADVIEIPRSPGRILVVDDEESVLIILGEVLRFKGYEVAEATNGKRALEIAEKTSFSAILCDQRMPGMTGLELLAKLRELQPNASRILLTGVVDLAVILEAINKGEIYRFLVKPWMREDLLVAIQNGVQRYQLLCRNAALQANTLAMNEQLAGLNRSLQHQVQREAEQNRQLEKLNRALERNLQRSVELCFQTMQTFYPGLGTQAKRAVEICRLMAEELRLSPADRQVLEISAWLHDIGLVGVPRGLIKQWQRSPDSLNEAEHNLITRHPVWGQELVGFIEHLEAVGPVIRAHHERFDGTGYPDRLVQEQIPWLARLLSVAVSYSESLRAGPDAIQEIQHGSGTAFDPEAVRLFLRCRPNATVARREQQVLLAELRPGMVLAKSIYTANGLLLMPEGQALSPAYIDKLLNHHQVHPIKQALLVYS